MARKLRMLIGLLLLTHGEAEVIPFVVKPSDDLSVVSIEIAIKVAKFCLVFHISVPIIHYSCHITEAEGEVWYP